MARFYCDENFPLPVAMELRRLGHDVVTLQDDDRGNQELADSEVLERATSLRRSVLTMNRKHFIHLHGSGLQHDGIVVCTFDPDFAAQAERIHVAVRGADPLTGFLIRVNRPA